MVAVRQCRKGVCPEAIRATRPAGQLSAMRKRHRVTMRPMVLPVVLFAAAAAATTAIAAIAGAFVRVASVGAQGATDTSARHPPAHDAKGADRQWIEIRNVDLHLTDQVVLRVRTLHGEVVRTSTQPATLDDPKSFRIRVTAATVGQTGEDLAALLNGVVFAYPGAPLRDIRLRTNGSEIIQTGIMHKGVDMRFRLHGKLDIAPDGRVRIHPTSLSVLGLNGEKVLHTLGMHLDNMLDLRGARGASVKGDDLFLDVTAILPPPQIEGRLASIRTDGDQVVQEFVTLPDDSAFRARVRADTADPSFIYFRGGELRFGKLLMNDTDLRIMNRDRKSPFDMSLPHYSQQLVAGRSQTKANLGLVVYMPDFAALQAKDSSATGAARQK